jgi:hypothetical protein
MVRTIKKPSITKDKPLPENIQVNSPGQSRFLEKMQERKPSEKDQYLGQINSEIYLKERQLEALRMNYDLISKSLEHSFIEDSERIRKGIEALESELVLKRAERAELDKPIVQRIQELDRREATLEERAQNLEAESQKVLQRERAAEQKLESVQDLADTLGETRVRLIVKEKQLNSRESLLKDNEMQYLVRIQRLHEEEKHISDILKTREYEISLKELDLQSREENLDKREKTLQDGNIRLMDQRSVLDRAWKELEKKQHG